MNRDCRMGWHAYKPVTGSHEHHHACTDCGANGYETSMVIGGDGYDGRCCGLADVEGIAELQCEIFRMEAVDPLNDPFEASGWYHGVIGGDSSPCGPYATQAEAFTDALEVWT